MDFRDKRMWIIGLLIIVLAGSFIFQNLTIKKHDKLVAAYDHNAVNTYNYLMATSNFRPAIEEIEELYELENMDDKELLRISDAFSRIIDHLMQLNTLRGYSENDELLKEEIDKVRSYSYRFVYKEQANSYEVINNIYLAFEDLLMDMYQNGIKDKHKSKVREVMTNIGQIEGTIKSSVNRNLNPNDLGELRQEYKKIESLLEKIEKILG